MKRIALVAALALVPALAPAYAADPVPPAMMWNLGDLYASPEAWTAAHAKAMTDAERAEVERLVNERVLENAPVATDVLPIAEAKAAWQGTFKM